MSACLIVALSLCPCATDILSAADIYVPSGAPSIQAAVSSAADGDTIIVAAGTYNETVNLEGKAVTLRSSSGAALTTIDATGLDGSVILANSGEWSDTVIDGFTITGGAGTAGKSLATRTSSRSTGAKCKEL